MNCYCSECSIWKPYTLEDSENLDYKHWLTLIKTLTKSICYHHRNEDPYLCHIEDTYLDHDPVISYHYKYNSCQIRYTLFIDSQSKSFKGRQITGVCSEDENKEL